MYGRNFFGFTFCFQECWVDISVFFFFRRTYGLQRRQEDIHSKIVRRLPVLQPEMPSDSAPVSVTTINIASPCTIPSSIAIIPSSIAMCANINANMKAALHINETRGGRALSQGRVDPGGRGGGGSQSCQGAHGTPLMQHPSHITPSEHQLQETGISTTEYEDGMTANFKEGRIYAAYNQNFARSEVVGVYTIWSGQHGAKTACKGLQAQ